MNKKVTLRVIIPDTHGNSIDPKAAKAFLSDLQSLNPNELVFLGDQVDASGVFSVHLPGHPSDLSYCYEEDCEAANSFLDATDKAAPKATKHFVEGNHEAHIARWAARTFTNPRDAIEAVRRNGPEAMLNLQKRKINFYSADGFHSGLPVRGTLRLGKCCFTHGVTSCKHAASNHLARFGCSVVFGHTHRIQSEITRQVMAGTIGAWSLGCLSQLQPMWRHTQPTDWAHGYGIQLVDNSTGNFTHITVPIDNGVSMLPALFLSR